MFLKMIIELTPLKRALSYFILVLVRRHRVLSDRVPMSILYGLRRLQIWVFVMFDLRGVAVGCGPGRGGVEVVVLVCKAGGGGDGDDHPGGGLEKWCRRRFIGVAHQVNREEVLSVLSLRSEYPGSVAYCRRAGVSSRGVARRAEPESARDIIVVMAICLVRCLSTRYVEEVLVVWE